MPKCDNIRFRTPVDVGESELAGLAFPRLGIVSTIGGTLAAMASIPDAVQDEGALWLPALISAIGLLLVPFMAALRDLRSLARAENVLAAAPVYWLLLDLLQRRYGIEIAERREVVIAFAAIGLFSLGIWCAALQQPWRMSSFVGFLAQRELTASSTFAITVSCFALGVFYYLSMASFDWQTIISSFAGTRWDAAWSRTTAEGGWEAFVEHLTYFGMLLPSLAVVLGRTAGWLDCKTLIGWLLALAYALFQAQGGNRRYLGVMFGAAIIVWLVSQRRPKLIHSLGVLASAATVLLLMEFVYEYRARGSAMFTQERDNESLIDFTTVRVDDNFLRLTQSIYYVPAAHPYVWYQYAFFALIRPIPRVIWPDKPLSPGFRIHDYIEIGASLSSSVVGELYVSGGLIVVLIGGWLYGRMGTWSSGLLSTRRTMPQNLLYGASLMALFAGCRSMMDLVLMTYVVLAALVLFWAFRSFLATAKPEADETQTPESPLKGSL